MDKLFVDTNVLIDHLAERQPFCEAAKQLFRLAEMGDLQMCVSSLSICNIAYIVRKLRPDTDMLKTLQNLSTLTMITSVSANTIFLALSASFKDFEDAVQHFSAVEEGGITHFITRNPKDFEKSLLPVVTPDEYLSSRNKT